MKLAFNGEAKYPDFRDGYELYKSRTRSRECLNQKTYNRVVREYCKRLAARLEEEGMVDLPKGLGSIAAVTLERKPQFRGDKFVGYGTMDWKKGHYDGSPQAFGIAFLPDRRKSQNLRCYGFVANRRLFQRMKERSSSFDCPWVPLELNDEMI